jgi:hypothetical protein
MYVVLLIFFPIVRLIARLVVRLIVLLAVRLIVRRVVRHVVLLNTFYFSSIRLILDMNVYLIHELMSVFVSFSLMLSA